MHLLQPQHYNSSSSSEGRSSFPIPMIYEHLPAQPLQWEYHILTVEAGENSLPDIEKLNALGREGWIMVGLLDERVSGRSTMVYYYFTRQKQEEQPQK